MLVISIKIRGGGEADTCAKVTISAENLTKIFRRIETKIITVHKGFTRSSPANLINQSMPVPSIQVNRGFPGLSLYCHLPAQTQHSASSGCSIDIFDWQKQLKAYYTLLANLVIIGKVFHICKAVLTILLISHSCNYLNKHFKSSQNNHRG